MEIEGIYLHGGAKGFCFINDSGTQTEYDSFFRRFYDKITKAAISLQKIDAVSKSFIIESLSISGKMFYDYTFMEYYVYDVSGRPSYLGITIRLSAFYSEITDLYFILDTVFKKDIIGNLLLPKETTYIVSKEQIDRPLFEMVMTDIIQLSSSVLQDSNLRSMRSVLGENSKGVNINLIDCQPKIIEKAISQYGRLNISTEVPLQRESQSQQEIDNLNEQWTTKWNGLQEKYTTADNYAQGLNKTILKLQGQLTQAQNNLRQVQKEFDDYKLNIKLKNDIINGLKEEKNVLLKLASFIDSLEIETPQAHKGHRKGKVYGGHENERYHQGGTDDVIRFNIKPYLSYIISAIVLTLIVWLLFFLKDCSGKDLLSFVDDKKKPKAEIVKKPKAELASEGESHVEAGQINGGNSAVFESVGTSNANNGTGPIDPITLTIDVAEFTKDVKYMTKNGAYTIRICDKVKYKPVEGVKGYWKHSDSDFYINNPNSTETAITPIRSGNDLEIQFFVDGYGTPIKRKFVVK